MPTSCATCPLESSRQHPGVRMSCPLERVVSAPWCRGGVKRMPASCAARSSPRFKVLAPLIRTR
jgi:hypothetical protein